MEVVTVVISALGLLFAAVAAWGAVRTVELTRQTIREADQRRILEALIALKHAALVLEELGAKGLGSSDADDRFRSAQEQLDRAFAVDQFIYDPVSAEAIDRLLKAHPRVNPDQSRQDAERAWLRLSSQRPSEKMPRWYLRAVAHLYGYRRSSA